MGGFRRFAREPPARQRDFLGTRDLLTGDGLLDRAADSIARAASVLAARYGQQLPTESQPVLP